MKSREQVFRAGLPQGSVLAPPLFCIWAALFLIIDALIDIEGCSPYMYADDTAARTGGDIETARRRAQGAADTVVS